MISTFCRETYHGLLDTLARREHRVREIGYGLPALALVYSEKQHQTALILLSIFCIFLGTGVYQPVRLRTY